jgi:[ribosomal protein S18]-alanine N-acetyltransferase
MRKGSQITIRPLKGKKEAQICARAMATSEPWITLRRGYEIGLKALLDKTREAYVATEGAAIAGYITLDVRGPFRGYIHLLCVMPEWRNRGVGALLIKHVEERVFREHPNVFLCVSSFNRAAQRFYKRMGFGRVGTLPDYIIKGHSEHLMRKTRGPIDGYRSAVPSRGKR